MDLKHCLRIPIFLALLASSLVPTLASAQEAVVDTPWRYTFRKPADGWRNADFADAAWREGSGGFGTPGTPGSRVGTVWSANQIWMRRTIEVPAIPAKPALYIHHDEDVEVFLNGREVARLKGYITEYKVVPLSAEQAAAIQKGRNVMAVHCRQTGGGQFVDVHLIDADHIPKLPTPARTTKPFISDLITPWGAEVTADNAWREYPRPALERQAWRNLNGHWDYAITKRDQLEAPTNWQGKILVPFALESKLSGVQRMLDSSESLWYHTTFESKAPAGMDTLLNFEAVDYRCQVFVNDLSVGKHTGGNDAFSMSIGKAVRPGVNHLVVRVEDDTEGFQLHGKQNLSPHGIWYTQVSGIWQTVWLEEVAPRHIADLKIATDAKQGSIQVRSILEGPKVSGEQISVRVLDGDREATKVVSTTDRVEIKLPQAKLWSPSSPHLYSLEVQLLDAQGKAIDEVRSYAGIRTVGKTTDAQGHLRFTLNGETIFHFGPLDQGWWPDGLLTPPSDAGMLSDIEYLQQAGFNMIRKHIKIEPRRYYYHCDRLGMLVWQDQVSGGDNPPWTRLEPNPRDAVWKDADHEQFMHEFEEMVSQLENHPCIVVWTPFNEAWGQHRTMEVGAWAVKRDPTRHINVASGGNFWPVGDIVDEHRYPHPGFPFNEQRDKGYIKVVGEFGGHGLPSEGHLWDNDRENWGYGGLPKNAAEYRERYVESIRLLKTLKEQGIAAGVYTQTTDVEGEINGLLTYDRKVQKLAPAELREIHRPLYE